MEHLEIEEDALAAMFFMDVDERDLAAMDEYDRQIEEKHRAARRRDSRALLNLEVRRR